MGLIDILTHYDTKKKAAHAMKTAKHGVSFICSSNKSFVEKKMLQEFTNH